MTRTVPLLLVVDDDAAVAGMLASDLTEAGYEVVRAANGQEGLESFERWHPDLVLTDDVMPHLDGFGLIEAIRRLNQTPIIVISERGGDPNRVRALGLGADDILAKPFSLNELLRRVRRQLRRLAADPGRRPGPGRRSSPQAGARPFPPSVHRHRVSNRLPLRSRTACLRRSSVRLITSFDHLPDFLGGPAATFGT